jgi:molecular chaperone IbpA
MILTLQGDYMNQLARFDLGNLNKTLLGFDKMFSDFENKVTHQLSYPPYNIVKYDDDSYELELAVTGFDPEDITVEVDKDQLVVRGEHSKSESEEKSYLHRSLAARDFVRQWTLAEHMEVDAGTIKNGVLTIKLTRKVPESAKPKTIKIKTL